MPTVAAFNPDRSAKAGAGRAALIRETPIARPYAEIAPGKLHYVRDTLY
jgi:hypothetical protein